MRFCIHRYKHGCIYFFSPQLYKFIDWKKDGTTFILDVLLLAAEAAPTVLFLLIVDNVTSAFYANVISSVTAINMILNFCIE
jgi:hypothetical protein